MRELCSVWMVMDGKAVVSKIEGQGLSWEMTNVWLSRMSNFLFQELKQTPQCLSRFQTNAYTFDM
jgi:hypothetical protein